MLLLLVLNVTVLKKTDQLARKSIIAYAQKLSFELEVANGKQEKKHFFEIKASDWLQIWQAASLLDMKGNKAMNLFFSLIDRFSQIPSLIICYFGFYHI